MTNETLTDCKSYRGCCLIVLLGLLFSAAGVAAQYKGNPVKKDKLIQVLRSRQLQTREIVTIVNSNGVDFALTPAVETELTTAGARPALIAAIRTHYRAETGSTPLPTANTANKSATAVAAKRTGEPITKSLLLTLLQNRAPERNVEQQIRAKGVNFNVTPQIAAEIKSAGGSPALIALVSSNSVVAAVAPASAAKTPVVTTAATNYDNLVERAIGIFESSKDSIGAISVLQQAVKLDSARPNAYQVLGYVNLYGKSDFGTAENFMREAILRGGSAVFRVDHDHGGGFERTCQGSLFVAKDTVRFEADDNVHTFDTTDANIKQVKLNNSFKRLFQSKGGSYKIVLNSGDEDGAKFSFAPLTGSEQEAKLVIRLIGKNS